MTRPLMLKWYLEVNEAVKEMPHIRFFCCCLFFSHTLSHSPHKSVGFKKKSLCNNQKVATNLSIQVCGHIYEYFSVPRKEERNVEAINDERTGFYITLLCSSSQRTLHNISYIQTFFTFFFSVSQRFLTFIPLCQNIKYQLAFSTS